ncbi:hypothetical protein CFOL_v3_00736, partial [Cephalotus follicularis]
KKRRTAEQSQENPPVPSYPETYFDRNILVGKTLDFYFCNREGFSIIGWLNAQGLEPLFSINLPSYPELIKEFYVKMLVNFDGELELKVKNKSFDLSFDLLASILEIPYDGTRAWNQRGWPVNDDFNREECVRLLFGENAQVVQRMYSRNLSLHYRFLHRAVATHTLPKASGFDEVTHMEAFTMFHIITGRRICVPQLIMKHMLAIHDRENARLAYSNIITKILMYFEVDLSGELHHSLQSTDRLRKGTLGRM